MPKVYPDRVSGVADGQVVVWDDGVFAGAPTLVDACEVAAALRADVRVHPMAVGTVTAGDRTAVEAAAAMIAAGRGRMLLREAPESVWALFPDAAATGDGDRAVDGV